MRVIIERDIQDDYIEIILEDEEIKKIMKNRLIIKEIKKGISKNPLGICVRRNEYAFEKNDEAEENWQSDA